MEKNVQESIALDVKEFFESSADAVEKEVDASLTKFVDGIFGDAVSDGVKDYTKERMKDKLKDWA